MCEVCGRYSDSLNLSDMNDKTAAEKLQGYWIMEIGELAGMKKADIDKVTPAPPYMIPAAMACGP